MRRYVLAALASVVIIGVALVLSSGDDDADDAARVVGGSTTTIAGAATTATTAPVDTVAPRGAAGNGNAVTFAFAGDVNFPEVWDTEDGPPPTAPPLAQQVRDDPKHVLDAITPVLHQADLAMVNVETAITDRRRARGREELPLPLAGGDVRGVEGGGRRRREHGQQPLARLRTAPACRTPSRRSPMPKLPGHRPRPRRRRGVPAVPHHDQGAAHRDPRARATGWNRSSSRRGRRPTRNPGIAFSIDRTRLLDEVQQVRPAVDTLVVFLHWGTEETWCASGEQQDLATALLGAGADIIVGSHAHRVFGAGKVGPGARRVRHWATSCTGAKTANRGGVACCRSPPPAARSTRTRGCPPASPNGVPVPQTGDAATADLAEWNARRGCSGLSP